MEKPNSTTKVGTNLFRFTKVRNRKDLIMNRTSVCILPGKPEVAFKELHTVWTSICGSWKVEAKVEGLESVPKFKVRTVRILRRNAKTGEFYDADLNPKLNIPSTVKTIQEDFRKLVREF